MRVPNFMSISLIVTEIFQSNKRQKCQPTGREKKEETYQEPSKGLGLILLGP